MSPEEIEVRCKKQWNADFIDTTEWTPEIMWHILKFWFWCCIILGFVVAIWNIEPRGH
jgi:hypothetical protein